MPREFHHPTAKLASDILQEVPTFCLPASRDGPKWGLRKKVTCSPMRMADGKEAVLSQNPLTWALMDAGFQPATFSSLSPEPSQPRPDKHPLRSDKQGPFGLCYTSRAITSQVSMRGSRGGQGLELENEERRKPGCHVRETKASKESGSHSSASSPLSPAPADRPDFTGKKAGSNQGPRGGFKKGMRQRRRRLIMTGAGVLVTQQLPLPPRPRRGEGAGQLQGGIPSS